MFQVCNAVYVRLNFTQPLCACPSRYRDPCSASNNADDLHSTELITDPRGKVSHICIQSKTEIMWYTPHYGSLVTFQLVKFSRGRLEVSHLTDDVLEWETKHILIALWFYHLIYRRPAGQLRSVFHRPKSNKWTVTFTGLPCKTRVCLKAYAIMNKSNIP